MRSEPKLQLFCAYSTAMAVQGRAMAVQGRAMAVQGRAMADYADTGSMP